MLTIKTFEFNLLRAHCYVASDENGFAAIVDPCFYKPEEKEELDTYIAQKGLKVDIILITHGHFDHVFGIGEAHASYPEAKIYFSSAENRTNELTANSCPLLGLRVPDYRFPYTDTVGMDSFPWHGRKVQVLKTPGHSEGSVCYYFEDDHIVFSGDTLFKGTIGRTDFATSSYDDIMHSLLHVVLTLPSDTDVLPGHGPSTTIAEEAMTNPMIRPIDEFLELDE